MQTKLMEVAEKLIPTIFGPGQVVLRELQECPIQVGLGWRRSRTPLREERRDWCAQQSKQGKMVSRAQHCNLLCWTAIRKRAQKGNWTRARPEAQKNFLQNRKTAGLASYKEQQACEI